MGGAQAIAALAYGTETIRPVDVIVGPGSLWVQEAKRQVVGRGRHRRLRRAVRPDGDRVGRRRPRAAAARPDGPGRARRGVAGRRGDRRRGAARAPARRSRWRVATDGMDAALAFAEALAPEHLQLAGAAAEALAPRVRSAGCLFVGIESGTAFGDYVAGSNHTLPTDGAARFASGLSARHFRRRMAEVRVGAGGARARARRRADRRAPRGSKHHAASMEIRENPPSR